MRAAVCTTPNASACAVRGSIWTSFRRRYRTNWRKRNRRGGRQASPRAELRSLTSQGYSRSRGISVTFSVELWPRISGVPNPQYQNRSFSPPNTIFTTTGGQGLCISTPGLQCQNSGLSNLRPRGLRSAGFPTFLNLGVGCKDRLAIQK